MAAGGTAQRDAVKALERLYDEKQREVRELAGMLARMKGMAVVVPSAPVEEVEGPYKGMGVIEAAQLWLREVKKPQTTSDLVQAMRARGWTTSSVRPAAVVYSTLVNAPKLFHRNEHGHWELGPAPGKHQEATR